LEFGELIEQCHVAVCRQLSDVKRPNEPHDAARPAGLHYCRIQAKAAAAAAAAAVSW